MDWNEFFESLSAWDGEDRVTKLQRLVKVKATHLPVRGRKSSETDWFNFLITQVVMRGKADCVIAGDKARELVAYLFPYAYELIEELTSGLLCVNEGTLSITDINLLHITMQMPHCKRIIAMEVEKIDEDYKSLDIRQLYAQVLKRKKQNSHDSRI